MRETTSASSPASTVLLVAGTLLTVLLALFLAMSDTLQRRAPAGPLAETAVAALPATRLPVSPLPTVTASPSPIATSVATGTFVPVLAGCTETPPDWVSYTVTNDDSLLTLALSAGLTVAELEAANCLAGRPLVEGMRLFLPPQLSLEAECGNPPLDWISYVVRRGDTLFALARRGGTTVSTLVTANCLESTFILAGERLLVPAGSAATVTPFPRPTLPRPTRTPRPTVTALPTATATPSLTTTPPTPFLTVTATPPQSVTPSPTATDPVTPTVTLTITITATPPVTETVTSTPPPPSSTPTLTPTPPAGDTPTPTLPPSTATPTEAPPPPTATSPPPPPTATSPLPPTNTPPPTTSP